jgi:hypothetical protein
MRLSLTYRHLLMKVRLLGMQITRLFSLMPMQRFFAGLSSTMACPRSFKMKLKALVILENNAKVWKDKAYGAVNGETNARYMMIAKNGSVRKSWSDEES